ncbi:MAG: DUF131 domain-containing protein [Thermoplasmata archaeon]|nr:DUF131 domain-containing protein [Thermoplasmata archaeon]MCI4356616.1 DUF131 domain-containing protein [Thermoplasmata archaeon]
MGATRWLGPGLIVLGLVLIGAAVATGAARFAVVVVFPVFFGGASALFLGGVLSVFLGVFFLPLAFDPGRRESEPLASPLADESTPGSGGFLLIGPVPIFFGAWKHPRRRTYWLAVAVGAVLLVAVLVAALWLG